MLNKAVCKRCVNEVARRHGFRHRGGVDDEHYWQVCNEVWQCECCTLQDTRAAPPGSCPYIAEHVVSQDG